MRKAIIFLSLILFSSPVLADLADCEYATVTTALASASPGDTVTCPADTVTWSGVVSVPANVTLAGNGIGNTVVSGNGAQLTTGSRLTGFEFATDVDLGVVDGAQGWRIDHNRLSQSTIGDWILIRGDCSTANKHAGGLIDNNTIINGGVGIFGCNDMYSDVLWYTGWQAYNDHTSGEKVYIEDNTFTNTLGGTTSIHLVDSNYSGRYVARYNTMTGGYFECHGARDSRGTQSIEIYENTITNNSGSVLVGNLRMGSGVIFNNDCSGQAIRCDWHVWTERCISGYPGTPYANSGECGAPTGPTSWDTSPHPATGSNHMCYDAFAGPDDSAGANDVTLPPDDQASLPAYFWGNTENGTDPWNFEIQGTCASYILEDRDFYMDDSSNGSFGNGGVAIGVIGSRPSSCTPYEAYWASDESILYKCTATDTWSSYYVPFTYPHPLQGGNPAPSGTVVPGTVYEIDVVQGFGLIMTLLNETFDTDTLSDGDKDNIMTGMDSSGSQANGWDAEVKTLGHNAGTFVISTTSQTNDTLTITFSANSNFSLDPGVGNDVVTTTLPASVLTGAAELELPSFTVYAQTEGSSNTVSGNAMIISAGTGEGTDKGVVIKQ